MGSRVWAGGESVDAELPAAAHVRRSALPGMRPARWGVDADDARPDTGEHHPGDVFDRETSGTGEQCSICVERARSIPLRSSATSIPTATVVGRALGSSRPSLDGMPVND